MRRSLKSEGVPYAVTKKSLTKRVLADEKFFTQPELTGELAVAWSEDLVARTRSVRIPEKFPQV